MAGDALAGLSREELLALLAEHAEVIGRQREGDQGALAPAAAD
jgi:hypothetical protein